MKNLSSAFLSHLQSDNVKTLCTAIKISSVITTDVYYLTDCFKDIIIDGDTYDSDMSYTVSAINKTIGNQVDSLTVSDIVPSSDLFEKAKKKLLQESQIDVYIVNTEDNSQFYQDFKGFINRVKIRDNTIDVEMEGLASKLLQNIIGTFEFTCPLVFGSEECGFDVTSSAIVVDGIVTGVTSRRTFEDTSITEGDDHFKFGILTWTSGNNNGLSKEVKTYDSGNNEFILFEPMPYDIEIGDTYSVYQGCDKDIDTCKDDFNNFVNFRGYLVLIPNADDLVYKPISSNPPSSDVGSGGRTGGGSGGGGGKIIGGLR